ncbi:MAG: NAD(P)-dependent oxidoreductase [Deltaproteobacteria bacterium]|nr:NAD(P)-dependent oxidoreductase [Deltaproteobacteria bacterium]
MKKNIGFFGLGTMGRPMAVNLAKGGYSVCAYDINPAAGKDLDQAGITIAKSPSEAAAGKDLVIIILPEKEEMNVVLPGTSGLLENIDPGTLLVDMGSHSLHVTLELAKEAERRKLMFLDAPVWGSRDRAVSGLLTILVGGSLDYISLCREIFSHFGLHIIHVGQVGDGTRMKFVVDMLQAQLIEALAEGFVLGEKLGFKMDQILEVLETGGVASPLFHSKGHSIARGDYRRNQALKYIYGSLLYINEIIERKDLKLPAAEAVTRIYEEAIKRGFGEEDFSAVAKVLKQ